VKRHSQLLTLKSQELEHLHSLHTHSEDTLRAKDTHLDKSLKDLSEFERKVSNLNSEIDSLKSANSIKHQELKNTNKFLEDHLFKIENFNILEKQLQIKEGV